MNCRIFLFSFTSLSRLFQSYETDQSVGGSKKGEHREKKTYGTPASCRKFAKGMKIYDFEKRTTGIGLPPPRGNIHVYYHNIQRSSSLKALGQSKPKFIENIYTKGEPMCF